jgi:hypothetical protein
LRACYFILTTVTTVGYGDFLPKNIYEQAMLCVIMLCAVAFFAYIMGSFNSAIKEYDELTSTDDKKSELNMWLDSVEILHDSLPKAMKQ